MNEEKITLELLASEVQLLIDVLANLPFRQSAGIITKIQGQATAQVEASRAAKEAAGA